MADFSVGQKERDGVRQRETEKNFPIHFLSPEVARSRLHQILPSPKCCPKFLRRDQLKPQHQLPARPPSLPPSLPPSPLPLLSNMNETTPIIRSASPLESGSLDPTDETPAAAMEMSGPQPSRVDIRVGSDGNG